MPLTCREFVAFLDDYISNTQPSDVRGEFERHLAECPPCVEYLETYCETIRLTGTLAHRELQQPVPEELIEAVVAARRKAK